ncbi:MAG: ABC transporter permease, partial [Finegoldia magna]|nr:ABC transporter permease [Finegoldia magna]
MRLKDNKIIILLIFLTSSILIFGFNYLYGNNRKPSPYFMNDKFIAFESNNNNHSLDFLNMNESISVVAEIKNSKDVAIYDPVMKYYMGSTKIIDATTFRYFSKEDYKNKNNVSILIYPVTYFVEGKISGYDKKEIEDKYHTEIINMFDVQSFIANDGKVDVVRNLFTIKPE